ncbi:TerB family tellurite resistance protein [Eisenibacter elegans]|jgi:uncharacterized tellurite resistance protein B-like protein|uniref:tellurite resistance TerB family protein n=1 Tax=Eisenibacter elegans TaxID=997 RepID=UPI000420EB16|nr:TerB family tellurite resistance protein [Eisenibacter elegans]
MAELVPIPQKQYTCPYCHERPIEASLSIPYVRGLLIAYQIGYRRFMGCRSCLRKKALQEVGVSGLVGWFSITAAVVNPILISYNLGQAVFVRPTPKRLRRHLHQLGLPEHPGLFDLTAIAYAMAAKMVMADGTAEEAEISIAATLGRDWLPDFEENEFRQVLSYHRDLPEVKDMALILRDVLDEAGKEHLWQYLNAIAEADGKRAFAERKLLRIVAQNLKIKPKQLQNAQNTDSETSSVAD